MAAYKDKRDGTWRYRKWIKLPNGTKTRITGTPATDTKVAAEAAERAHIDRVLHPERFASEVTSAVSKKKEVPFIKEFAKRFEAEYLPRSKPTERKSKKYVLSGSIVPYFGGLRLDEVDQSHVNAFVATQSKLAVKTINNRLTVLKTLLRYAHDLKLIPEPTIKAHVKGMSPDIVAVSRENVAKLIAAATDERYRLAVLLATEAGLRVGEIRGLQHTDVRDGVLTVRRAIDQFGNTTTPKHDKRRAVPLSPALAKALAEIPRRAIWVLSDADGEPLNYERMLEAINALYVAAEVEVPKSETGITMPWHSLRHTFGTECAARGVPVPVIKDLMGHSSIATTMRYVTVTGDQLTSAIALAFGDADRKATGGQRAEEARSS